TVHCAARTARVRGEKRGRGPRERNRRYRSRKHEEGHDHDSARGAPTVAQEGGAVMKRGVAARTGREVRQQVLAFLGHDCRVAHGHLRNLMPACFSMLLSVPTGKSPPQPPKAEAPDRPGNSRKIKGLQWSGRLDLNQRPLAPQASALPGCATPRHCGLDGWGDCEGAGEGGGSITRPARRQRELQTASRPKS